MYLLCPFTPQVIVMNFIPDRSSVRACPDCGLSRGGNFYGIWGLGMGLGMALRMDMAMGFVSERRRLGPAAFQQIALIIVNISCAAA